MRRVHNLRIPPFSIAGIAVVVVCSITFFAFAISPDSHSVIAAVTDSLSSVVLVRSENAVMAQSPAIAFIDQLTRRLILTKRARAAKLDRMGAGVIVDPSGIIATNAHVVKDAARISVALKDGTVLEARIAGISGTEDLAFIRVFTEKELIPMEFADSSLVKPGETVYTIGASSFTKGTIAQGRITGIGKRARAKDLKGYCRNLFQTDFSLHKGDSGAPIMDSNGRLLGLLFAAASTRPEVSFAIPSNKIKKHYLDYLSAIKKR